MRLASSDPDLKIQLLAKLALITCYRKKKDPRASGYWPKSCVTPLNRMTFVYPVIACSWACSGSRPGLVRHVFPTTLIGWSLSRPNGQRNKGVLICHE